MQKKFPIHRTRIKKDIVAEFAVPPTNRLREASKVAILAPGVPTKSSKAPFMEFLAKKGFYVVCPQYRGVWESDGIFLEDEPTKDISDTIQAVRKKGGFLSLMAGETYQFPKEPSIYIFAGSFGGPAGIFLSRDPRVTAVVCVSPVVDWTMRSKAEPLDWMYTATKEAFGMGYRMEKKDWNKLGKTDFYDPTRQIERVDGEKIIIFHAKDDESVPSKTVEKFAKRSGAKAHISARGGHLSLFEVSKPARWKRIQRFFEKCG